MLARELGMTVHQLLHTITAAELAEWIAFFNLDHLKKQIRREQMTVEDRTALVRAKFKGMAQRNGNR